MRVVLATLVSMILCVHAMAQDEKPDIRTVQQLLNEWGYNAGPVDGQWGRKTRGAILAFQIDWELEETGKIDDELIARLNRTHEDTMPRWQAGRNTECQLWNPEPQARQSFSYRGDCVDGKAEGKGKHEWRVRDGGVWVFTVYKGEYRDGRPHGRGKATYPNGARYVGEYRLGKSQGRGTLHYANGNRYVGAFYDGKPNGIGTAYYTNGERYEGRWKDGVRHGKGILVAENGDRHEGEWRHGKRRGPGVLVFENGNRFAGEYRDDKRNGDGIFYWADGHRFEGTFRNDVPHGEGTLELADGRAFAGVWKKGCLNAIRILTETCN